MILHPAHLIERYTAAGVWSGATLHHLLLERVHVAPQALALTDPPNKAIWTDLPPQRMTWSRVVIAVDRLAWALHRVGLRRDDVLLVQLPNIAEFALLHLACARLGVVISPLHVQQRQHEVLRCAAIAQARAFVTLRRLGKTDQQAFVRELREQRDFELPVYWLEDLIGTGNAAGEAEIAAELDAAGQQLPVTANDIHTICWTSGTEGDPKGVPRSHNNWVAVARRIVIGAGLKGGDVLLNPFPLVAVAGMTVLIPWLLLGGRLVMHQPSDLAVLLRQIREEGAHYVCIAPALLNRLLLEPDLVTRGDIATLRVIGSGSGPIDPWTIAAFRDRLGIEIVNFYGSNEGVGLTAGPEHVPDPALRAVLFPAVGRPGRLWGETLEGLVTTRLIDRDSGTEVLQPGEPGELAVRGPTVFAGYYGAPERNAAAFTADGEFLTGDMFTVETQGAPPRPYYRFMGRYKDIIVRGGMKISPEELDGLLVGHPLLLEAACCGYRDAVMGEKVGVAVVPRPGLEATLGDVTAWLREAGVATYKLPEALVIMDALPRNALNKVLRRELPPLFARYVSTTPV